MVTKESILVFGGPGGGSQKNAGGGRILRGGLLGIEPCFCAWPHEPLPAAPKDVATLSQGAKGLRKRSLSSG